MYRIKLTSKRQATFPKEVCESLGVVPGSILRLERQGDEGSESWVLSPVTARDRPWLGALRKYGEGRAHDQESIRESVAQGRVRESG